MSEGNPPPSPGPTPSPPRLEVGGLVSGGRYQLLEPHGGMAGQSFWRAHDKRLRRDVALTFVDPLPGEQAPGSATGVLDRTVALTGVYSDGLARVLDVIRGRAGGIVVSEWVPGRSLAAAAREPDPDAAVGAVWGLSDAATRAEADELVLGLDSPDRIRVTDDGRALLAFPGVRADSDTRGDVRGLGAVLYCLLTGTWPTPLPAGTDDREPRDGRPPAAPRDDDDEAGADTAADDTTATPLDPTRVRPGVPQESAVLAMRSLDGSTVSSAATVRSMVTDRTGGPVRGPLRAPAATATTAAAAGTTMTGAAAASSSAVTSPAASAAGSDHPTAPGHPDASGDRSASDGDAHPGAGDHESYSPPDERTLKRRWQIMAGVSAVAVIGVVLLGVWMLGALGGQQEQVPLSQQLDAIERAAQQSRESEARAAENTDSADNADSSGADAQEPADDAPSTPVEVTDAASWQPASSAGNPDDSSGAPDVIDGDPATSWSTDTYVAQLGDGGSAFKPGIGLMLSLDGAQETGRVVVHSDDDEVRFEVRSATSANPDSLDETTLLGQGTVRDGSGTADIDTPEESEHVLVWITRLGTSGPQAYSAEITEVELLR